MVLPLRHAGVLLTLLLPSLPAVADTVDDRLNSVLTLLLAGDAAGALKSLDEVTSPSPAQLIRARYYRAYAHKRKGDLAACIAEFERFLPREDAPHAQREAFKETGGLYAAKAEFNYAEALFDAVRFDEAAPAYGRFAQDFQSHERAEYAIFRKEESLRSARRYQDAYNYLLALPTPTPEAEIQVAVRRSELLAQFLRTDYALSNQLLTDIIAKYPDHPTTKNARIRLARNCLYDLPPALRDYPRARSIALELIKAFPDWNMTTELRTDVGFTYYYQKDYLSAAANFQAALEACPDRYPADNTHPYLHYLVGDAFAAAGRAAQAREEWAVCTARYPADNWSRLARARLEGSDR